MPIVSEAHEGKRKRRSPVLALLAVFAVLALLLGGAVAWSWFHPVVLATGGRGVAFGRQRDDFNLFNRAKSEVGWDAGNIFLKFPGMGRNEVYRIAWRWEN